MQLPIDLPPTDTDLPFAPAHTSCGNCDEPVHRDDVIIKTYHTGTTTEQEHFCSNACHHAWYLDRLRQWGM